MKNAHIIPYKMLASWFALALVLTTPAFAAPETVTLTGEIPPICKVVKAADPIVLQATTQTSGQNAGRVTFPAQSVTGQVKLVCNVANSTIKVEARPMTLRGGYKLSTGSASAGFTDTIDYGVSLTGATAFQSAARIDAGTTPAADPDSSISDTSPYGAYASTFAMTVSHVMAHDNKTPVAGAYSGVISVTISP